MATTILPASTPRTDSPPRHKRMGAALANVGRQGATMASAARHRLRRPALTIAGFGSIDAAFFHLGWFWGLLVTGISVLVFDDALDDDQPGGGT